MKNSKMKLITIFLALILLSCSNRNEFVYGIWEIGDEKGKSQFEVSKENRLTWKASESSIIDNAFFEILANQKKELSISVPDDKQNSSTKLTFIEQDEHTALLINYKDHINSNMIDEVFVAKRNVNKTQYVQKPPLQELLLTNGYRGDIYVKYTGQPEKNVRKIKLNSNGVGEGGIPDFRQLFNANRTFKFENTSQVLKIVNPFQYGELYLNSNQLEAFSDEDVIIVQLGFNQSKRENLIDNIGIHLENDQNVEHFKCMTISELKTKYDL